MTNTLRPVGVTAVSDGSFTTVYTVPGSTTFTASMLHVCNTTVAVVTVRVCLVPPAGSPGTDNAILWDFSIAANDVLELLKGDIWAEGSTLQAKASSAGVSLKLAGIESA